jgi:hypothetical protein
MAMQYKVIINTAQPSVTENTVIWVQPASGQSYIYINAWIPLKAGAVIASYTLGTVIKTLIRQTYAPAGSIGQLWYNELTNRLWIYLDAWYEV